MPRPNAFKANTSFFRMIALGAVGAEVVQEHLNALGHEIVELERGSLSTKIWSDVKRKRVRIPDLCCTSCGVRVESRAKTNPDLRMSHSTQEAEGAWDYGMLDTDWIAFPVISGEEDYCSACDRQRTEEMLLSRERTSRFTGCKLARLARMESLSDIVRDLAKDAAEDTYVRMEARSFLCAVTGEGADSWFREILLRHPDDQIRLEAVVALSEVDTSSSFELLRLVLGDECQPLFLRSACAWAMGCHRTPAAAECLVRAFADISVEIRNEALAALENVAGSGP